MIWNGSKGSKKEIETKLILYEKRSDLLEPAAMIARGEVVAFPTETVYGLGANALDPQAVAKIFEAKGRPADNPLIVHVSERDEIIPLVKEISPLSECLAEAFMPGPITLVMYKSSVIPDIVSAGLPTVGIRLPSNRIARELIALSGVPVAAPSANESGGPSPTRASHVMRDLKGKIACVVDGGPSEVGLESTVVDVTGNTPVILRPGAVTAEMIEKVCCKNGFPVKNMAISNQIEEGQAPKAPGMKYRHYAPKAPIRIIYPQQEGYENTFLKAVRAELLKDPDRRIGVFCGDEIFERMHDEWSVQTLSRIVSYHFGNSDDVDAASSHLFAALRWMDKEAADIILAAGFESSGLATAYMNRLEKAAGAAGESGIDGAAQMTVPDKEYRRILFVCTGNTCRSPMAEAIFNALAESRGPYVSSANKALRIELTASSAGIYADFGSPAAAYAEDAVRDLYGVDLGNHRSRKTTQQLLSENDLVLAMTRDHAAYIRSNFPEFRGRVYSIFEYLGLTGTAAPVQRDSTARSEIPDPYGRNLSVYENTAAVLKDLIDAMFPKLLNDLGIEQLNKSEDR
jgi:tRNA threonylcarbamoyl adenosine modification protein (Sua5/YciO/YrdC/YwlC family)